MNNTATLLISKRAALILLVEAVGFCARSQNVTLTISPAVHVTWSTVSNKAYQVEISTNLPANWVPMGGLIEGTGGQAGAYFETKGAQNFFRVAETGASGMAWLEGTWQGQTYQASSNSVPFTARVSITNSNRAFNALFSNNTFSCTSTLNLLPSADAQARFYSAIQSGPCVNGIVVLVPINTTNLLYNWYYADAPSAATSFGLLSKMQ